MKRQTLRVLVPVVIGVIALLGFAMHLGFGSLSSFGWEDIAVLCPLGALGSMLASKTLIPRAVIALVIASVAIALLGRAFCGWICPVPATRKIAGLFRGKKKPEDEARAASSADTMTEQEKATIEASIAKSVKSGCGSKKACGTCADVRAKIDSRHFVLAGGLLSAAIFGFPVFCLVCPIGLSFGTLFLLVQLFGGGDVTWTVVAVPVLLVLELVVFRKWCSRICPLSALMSLVGRLNRRSMRPVVDSSKCVERKGVACGKCRDACEVQINPRHPQDGADFAECTKCFACVDACPGHAIKMPLLAPAVRKDASREER